MTEGCTRVPFGQMSPIWAGRAAVWGSHKLQGTGSTPLVRRQKGGRSIKARPVNLALSGAQRRPSFLSPRGGAEATRSSLCGAGGASASHGALGTAVLADGHQHGTAPDFDGSTKLAGCLMVVHACRQIRRAIVCSVRLGRAAPPWSWGNCAHRISATTPHFVRPVMSTPSRAAPPR